MISTMKYLDIQNIYMWKNWLQKETISKEVKEQTHNDKHISNFRFEC